MNLSAFDIIGPVMVGPSSSHTAGAARLGWVGHALLGSVPQRAVIGLHGSFAATGRGHGTDRALLAGLLGDPPDAENLPDAPERARAMGLDFVFEAIDLGEQAHPNSVELKLASGQQTVRLIGASLGGGVIHVSEVDGLAVNFGCARPTLVCWHEDRRGFLYDVTAVLAAEGRNIATLSTARVGRSAAALTVIETDEPLLEPSLAALARIAGLRRHRYLPPLA
ncbi:MAG TPA: L-serine ammonia-lyase, iron-sulfur-dependent subunit beta [Candidatus Synoicihabitans sp.]|nr:L-serine ammonia-lyase, iron-sulfur-dependent subunit beta [Candidatus Synoicihabitans sp.]